MTRSTIPIEIRRCAMWCHLFNLLWLFIVIGGICLLPLVPGSDNNERMNLTLATILILPPVSLLGSRILSLIVWIINRRRHPFIEESGKEAINFSLSIDLYVFVIGAISLASCGLYSFGAIFGSLGIIALIISVLLLFHSCLVLVGGIDAWKGLIYRYPLTIRFFR